jgi:hypothetical protein
MYEKRRIQLGNQGSPEPLLSLRLIFGMNIPRVSPFVWLDFEMTIPQDTFLYA